MLGKARIKPGMGYIGWNDECKFREHSFIMNKPVNKAVTGSFDCRNLPILHPLDEWAICQARIFP